MADPRDLVLMGEKKGRCRTCSRWRELAAAVAVPDLEGALDKFRGAAAQAAQRLDIMHGANSPSD